MDPVDTKPPKSGGSSRHEPPQIGVPVNKKPGKNLISRHGLPPGRGSLGGFVEAAPRCRPEQARFLAGLFEFFSTFAQSGLFQVYFRFGPQSPNQALAWTSPSQPSPPPSPSRARGPGPGGTCQHLGRSVGQGFWLIGGGA